MHVYVVNNNIIKMHHKITYENKRLEEQVRELILLHPSEFRFPQQNAALNQYLEKAHRELELHKKKEEEEKKIMEELKTQLALKSAQVINFIYNHCILIW